MDIPSSPGAAGKNKDTGQMWLERKVEQDLLLFHPEDTLSSLDVPSGTVNIKFDFFF